VSLFDHRKNSLFKESIIFEGAVNKKSSPIMIVNKQIEPIDNVF
jgi:hypothetical protein